MERYLHTKTKKGDLKRLCRVAQCKDRNGNPYLFFWMNGQRFYIW